MAGQRWKDVGLMFAHKFFIILRNMSILWIPVDSNDLFFVIYSKLANLQVSSVVRALETAQTVFLATLHRYHL